MTQPTRQSHRRRGSATVEFAVIVPLILLLLVGIWEVGRMLEVQQLLVNAAREGGRQATSGTPQEQIEESVRIYLRNAGIPTYTADRAQVTFDSAHKTTQTYNAYKVTVSVPLRELQWIVLDVITKADTALTGESVWSRD